MTHAERVLFPDSGITKGDLVAYYGAVAPAMLPYVMDRPANLQRFPSGITGPGFFQQARPPFYPDWVPGVTVATERGRVEHPVLQSRAALQYVANQGCITPHVWLSRIGRLRQPDQLVFDLDPPDSLLGDVAAAARQVAAVLEEVGLVPFVKTTGSRGYHVTVPLDERATYDTVRNFANGVAALLVRRQPELFTVAARKAARGERIYLDTLRNAYGHTVVPPYAVRARPGAPVATPLAWDELADPAMHSARFTMRDVPKRLASRPDPWRAWRRSARAIGPARARLAQLR
ncbi:MAG TPA: non-homologous end-joining DNA ligase [Gemmatimonadales bacterium]|nr:non-homologous end-joining DNA ligase [Gemmatimonadales bacterium]